MEEDFLEETRGRQIDLIVCSDAEQILGIGDQGVGVSEPPSSFCQCSSSTRPAVGHRRELSMFTGPSCCAYPPEPDRNSQIGNLYVSEHAKRTSPVYHPCFFSRLIGGVNPANALSVTLDVGTDNEELLNDHLYVVRQLSDYMRLPSHRRFQGWPHKRVRGKDYDEFIDKYSLCPPLTFPAMR